MDQYDKAESRLAFSFQDKDFMDFLPDTQEGQFKTRWADFNFHDPGVTTYEALQFSFEDFFYRYNFPITDLLQGEGVNAFDSWSLLDLHSFYAVTENDYRRLLANSHNIYNIAVKPVLKSNTPPGTVELICLLNVDVASHPFMFAILSFAYLKRWEEELIKNRALGEYFNRQTGCATFIREKKIFVDIRARVTFAPDGLMIVKRQKLKAALEEFLLPNLDSKPYRYVKKDNNELREVHNGPLISDDVQNNAVEEKELQKPSYRRYIVVSELYAVAEKLDFVQSVESIEIRLIDGDYQSSILDLGEYTFTQLRTFNLNGEDVARVNVPERKVSADQDSFSNTYGKYRNLSYSQTLQDSFPVNYNMGRNLHGEDIVNVNQTSSFRAYLYLMDQIRADLAAQLGNLSNVFTIQLNQPEIEEADITDQKVYEGIQFDAVQPDGLFRSKMESLNYTFREERLNYLLALNGWGVATDADIFWDVRGYTKTKNEFLNLVSHEIYTNLDINKDLNVVFKSKSLIMLQEKLRILLQNGVATVRLLEHYLLQPVWEGERGLNFEMTVFLFKQDPTTENERTSEEVKEEEKFIAYAKAAIRMLTPAHIVVHAVWKNESDLNYFDGLLKTAFPPKSVYYLDEAITPQQRFAMNDLRDNWLQIY